MKLFAPLALTYFCVNTANPVCPTGYEGVPPACTDINECDEAGICGDHEGLGCVNTPGGHHCDCMTGFQFNSEATCVDIDECAESPCVNGLCENGFDSYTCNCFDNFVQLPGLSDDVCYLQSAYECFDGSNGGCSHFCSVDGCGCPDCWDLLSDGKTCVPSTSHLHVACSANSMTMSVDECVYGSGEDVELTLADNACTATQTMNSYWSATSAQTNFWSATSALDNCGTTVSAEDGLIKFQNSLTVQSRSSAIVMHSDPDITFTCEYSASVDGVSSSISVLGETHTAQGSTSDGVFEFILNFVAPDKDGAFSVAANDTMIVGERVYFDVSNTNPISGVNFVVQDCEISDAHGNAHKVVDGNCLDSNTFVQREADYDLTVASDKARFSYTAFIFANSPDTDSANLDLVCNIAACLEGDCADIVNDCNARRRRRAVAPKTQIYKVAAKAKFSDL